jgi:hypothetical protein
MNEIFPTSGAVTNQRAWFEGTPNPIVRGTTYQMIESEYGRLNFRRVRDSVCHPDPNAYCDSLVVVIGDLFTMPLTVTGGGGNISAWTSAIVNDIELGYRSLDAVSVGNCDGPSSAPKQKAASAPRFEPEPEGKIPCRLVLRRDPKPFANVDLMQDYVDVFHGTEKAGDVFTIQEKHLGTYYVVDSSCSWSYECDTIILIAGDYIRATRTPPARTRDLVRSWTPEVVYKRDTIPSNCDTPTLPSFDPVGAPAQMFKAVKLPAADLTDPSLRVNDPIFDIPYPHLQYYSDARCSDFTIRVTRATYNSFFEEYEIYTVQQSVRDCDPIGPIGDFLANVTCDGVIDASHLVCDSILSVDTVRITHKVVEAFDFFGETFYNCKDSVSFRLDSIYTYTCWKACAELPHCDTVKRSGDTIIHYIEDSIVTRTQTFYDLGHDYPQQLCPVLDTMNIVMNVETQSGCFHRDTFRLIRLTVPRALFTDTAVSQGDTLHLFANSDSEHTVTQWWEESSNKYFKANSNDLILDQITISNADPTYTGTRATFSPNTRFIGDTTPISVSPTAFRGDTVDMILHSQCIFQEYDNRVCTVRDTVAIQVMDGYRIGGYISYDSFWDPNRVGTPCPTCPREMPHRPINNVTVKLYRVSTGELMDSTKSDVEGFYKFNRLFPPDKYVLDCSAPQKGLAVNAGPNGGITNNDAALMQSWIANRSSMPYRNHNVLTDPNPTKTTMMYVAANVNESVPGSGSDPENYFGINNVDVQDVQNMLVSLMGTQFLTMSLTPVNNWKFSNDTIDLTRNEDSVHVFGVMSGDANLDYMPIDETNFDNLFQKSARQKTSAFDIQDTIFINSKDQFINYPILAQQHGELLGMQLWMNIPPDVEVLQVLSADRNMSLAHNIVGNKVLFSWLTNNSMPITFRKGDPIVNLVLKVNRSKSIKQLSQNFSFDLEGYEVTDKNLKVITPNFKIALPIIVIDNTLPITILDSIIDHGEEITDTTKSGAESITMSQDSEIRTSKIINVIPNPMSERADVTYSISEESVVTMKLINMLGVEIKTLINGEQQDIGISRIQLFADGVPNGVYVLRLETVSKNRRDIDIEKIVVSR